MFILTALSLLLVVGKVQYLHTEETFTLHSRSTDDDYVIKVLSPPDFKIDKKYHIIIVLDGSLGLGSYVRNSHAKRMTVTPHDQVVITVAHTGEWKKKRERDFISSDASGRRTPEFGQAGKFYSFIQTELLPVIDEKYPNQKSRVLIGHSLSGSFCLYAALRADNLFDQYFAISPSVWVNQLELLKFEREFLKNKKTIRSTIHIYVGSLEVFNRVLSSSRKFYNEAKSKNFKGLNITFEIIKGVNHFSIRKPAIDKIFETLSE